MGENEQEVTGREVELLEGEFVRISGSSVRNVEAGRIEMEQVCAFSVDGEKVESSQSAAVMTSGRDVTMNQSMSIISAANKIKLKNSIVSMSLTRENASIKKSAAGIIAAGTIHAESSTAFLLLANKVEGEVNTILDWKAAAAASAVLGGIWGLFMLLRRR
jgi:hypothetical protein